MSAVSRFHPVPKEITDYHPTLLTLDDEGNERTIDEYLADEARLAAIDAMIPKSSGSLKNRAVTPLQPASAAQPAAQSNEQRISAIGVVQFKSKRSSTINQQPLTISVSMPNPNGTFTTQEIPITSYTKFNLYK